MNVGRGTRAARPDGGGPVLGGRWSRGSAKFSAGIFRYQVAAFQNLLFVLRGVKGKLQGMAKLFLLRSTVLAAAFAVCATAQPRAPIDPKSWLTPEVSTGDQNLPIQPVSGVIVPEERRAAAAGLLINTQIVEISYQEARLFDVEPRNLLGIAGATAFLVRGVSPNGGGMCNASLQGNALSVFCVSLGDFNYELRPIIVFLHQKPGSVTVGAATAR